MNTLRICPDHWHEVENAIRQRGLWELVALNGRLPARVVQQETAPSPFDPLIATSLMICDQALMAFGFPWGATAHCPLCDVDRNLGPASAAEWIDVDADTVLQFCREHKLISL